MQKIQIHTYVVLISTLQIKYLQMSSDLQPTWYVWLGHFELDLERAGNSPSDSSIWSLLSISFRRWNSIGPGVYPSPGACQTDTSSCWKYRKYLSLICKGNRLYGQLHIKWIYFSDEPYSLRKFQFSSISVYS